MLGLSLQIGRKPLLHLVDAFQFRSDCHCRHMQWQMLAWTGCTVQAKTSSMYNIHYVLLVSESYADWLEVSCLELQVGFRRKHYYTILSQEISLDKSRKATFTWNLYKCWARYVEPSKQTKDKLTRSTAQHNAKSIQNKNDQDSWHCLLSNVHKKHWGSHIKQTGTYTTTCLDNSITPCNTAMSVAMPSWTLWVLEVLPNCQSCGILNKSE